MFELSDRNYNLEVDAEDGAISGSLGNLSDAGWFWTFEDYQIGLALARLMNARQDTAENFINALKKVSISHPKDWEFFKNYISNPTEEVIRSYSYFYLGGNGWESIVSEEIEDAIGANISMSNLPDFLEEMANADDNDIMKSAEKIVDGGIDTEDVRDEYMTMVNGILEFKIVARGQENALEYWRKFVEQQYNGDEIVITDSQKDIEFSLNSVYNSLASDVDDGSDEASDVDDGSDEAVVNALTIGYREGDTHVSGVKEVLQWFKHIINDTGARFDWARYREAFIRETNAPKNTMDEIDYFVFDMFANAPKLDFGEPMEESKNLNESESKMSKEIKLAIESALIKGITKYIKKIEVSEKDFEIKVIFTDDVFGQWQINDEIMQRVNKKQNMINISEIKSYQFKGSDGDSYAVFGFEYK